MTHFILARMMRWLARAALLGAMAAAWVPMCAQDEPVAKDQADAKPAPGGGHRGGIIGTVICADTHRPARGALLLVTGLPAEDGGSPPEQRETTTRTALDGSYSVEHLAAGEYAVLAFYPGYLSAMDGVKENDMDDPKKMREVYARNGTVTVRGAESARFNVVLERGAAVSGRVLYSDGSAAAQVGIDLEDVKSKPATADSPEANLDAGKILRFMFTHES